MNPPNPTHTNPSAEKPAATLPGVGGKLSELWFDGAYGTNETLRAMVAEIVHR